MTQGPTRDHTQRTGRTPGGGLAAAPGAPPLARMVLAQSRVELKALLRNGEQLLLVLVVPLLLLLVLAALPVLLTGPEVVRLGYATPGIIALAAMSTAFTGQAIATGFERRYGVLKLLGTTPLPRVGLLGAKALAVLVVVVVQGLLLSGVALLLGWQPAASATGIAAAVGLLVLGTVTFLALALLMAGTLRAEATLALANLVYVLLLAGSGVAVPLDRVPRTAGRVLELLPLTALAEGLRALLRGAGAGGPALVLLVWAVLAGGAAGRWFRWE